MKLKNSESETNGKNSNNKQMSFRTKLMELIQKQTQINYSKKQQIKYKSN
jgi:hypothetical protein